MAALRTGSVSARAVPALLAGMLATVVAALLVRCLGAGPDRAAARDRVVRWWARVWLRAAGVRLQVSGRVEPGRAYVVVANHQSDLDPMVHLAALGPLPLRVLAKRELFGVPLLGPAMRAVGMIDVDRRAPDLDRLNAAAGRALAGGASLLVYPEGTTTPDGTVAAFKDGAFVIAAANRVPILPVAVHGTGAVWPKRSLAIRGGAVRVAIGAPVEWTGPADAEPARLRERTRAAVEQAHRELVEQAAGSAAPVSRLRGAARAARRRPRRGRRRAGG